MEIDDFVIIPAVTPFPEIVTAVLTLLSYPKDIIQQAEGEQFFVCFKVKTQKIT